MAHVRIRSGEGVPATASIEVDGVDISRHVLAYGFGVEFPEEPDGVAHIKCRIVAKSLDLDLPGAVIEALRAEGEK